MTKMTAGIAALTLLMAVPVSAQTGLFVGAHATGASLTKLNLDDPVLPLDFGSGLGVHAGLSFGNSVGVLVNYEKSIRGTISAGVDFGQWDFLGRIPLAQSGTATTYATAGVSKRAAKSSSGDFPIEGIIPTAGLTGQVILPSKLALDASVLLTFGDFTDGNGHSGACVARFAIGASYFLFGKR